MHKTENVYKTLLHTLKILTRNMPDMAEDFASLRIRVQDAYDLSRVSPGGASQNAFNTVRQEILGSLEAYILLSESGIIPK
ncbi:hypothetical protein [Microvirga sp. 2TAF3]|uniref:hypothetical protein n=1 Tax=Microvirga sp. 2TAF3 TaxID=3233014 RepID=UPI003F9BB0F7